MFGCRLGVEGNAAVAAGGDADGQRDQFLGLDIQRPLGGGSAGKGGEVLHGVGNALVNLAQGTRQIISQLGPILVHQKLLM